MAKAADIVVQCLGSEGIEYVFSILEEENLPLRLQRLFGHVAPEPRYEPA